MSNLICPILISAVRNRYYSDAGQVHNSKKKTISFTRWKKKNTEIAGAVDCIILFKIKSGAAQKIYPAVLKSLIQSFIRTEK